MKKMIITLIVLAVLGLVGYSIYSWQANRLLNDPRFACGNGRIEATEINIAARLSGKVEKVFVLEGQKVNAGQVMVAMQTNVLVAKLAQAEAKRAQAVANEASAKARVTVLESTLDSRKAELERAKAALKNAEANYVRYKQLVESKATSEQHFQTAETNWLAKKADHLAAKALVQETIANIEVSKADVLAAQASIKAADAEIASYKADIDDSILKAPLAGRVQYRVAEPGEVLSEGGRAINMVDLTDVYMTFFLPEKTAGKVRIGAPVRIVLDAVPEYPFPAKVTYVASVAQFTPKTVETREERQKLMFRVKAHIDREILEKYIDIIKTGIPGVAWIKLDNTAEWPKQLELSPEAQAQLDRFQGSAEKQQSPDDAVNSETKKAGKQLVLNPDELKKKIQGGSKEKAVEVEVDAMKQVNAARNAKVEDLVSKAKENDQRKQDSVSKTVDQAKKTNEAAQKAVVGGDGK